ncbi:Phage protein [Vibrio crassostreae]|nr:Phage protein [Vibrio crassostreae]CAK2696450.1 Phage protein [Vibrio crassostreae]CAK3264000.1 Phage protein [Vibrio crassostreae]
MNFMLIKPTRADIKAQFALIKSAFNGVHCAKAEYQFCCEAVRNKQASFYHLKGAGVSVRFVGLVTSDNEYLILAMTGKGLVKAAPCIIEAVKSQGYRSIKYHTVRRGMERILKAFGFVVADKTEHESVLSLAWEGC